MRRLFSRRIGVCFAAAFILLLTGCGKAGPPVPKKTQDTFMITASSATIMGDCLVASGTVTGAVNNFAGITMEIDPVDSISDCPGCPFTPRESQGYSPSEAQFDPATGQFIVSFCPSSSAPMYRWRLVGNNIYPGLPYAITTPQVTIVP